jgi:glyoxylase-like metal-dependent hydrolase (beta-lactamase superfamily II)
MKVPATGPIHERITAITDASYPIYIVRGDESELLLDSGPNMLGPSYLASLSAMFPDGGLRPRRLLLTHSHWDHVGSADYLRRHMPGLQIGGHSRLATVVRKSSALETMNRLSTDQVELLAHSPSGEDLTLRPFEIDVVLKQGDEFDLGGLTCMVYETPGHTRDSLAYYFPEIKALFPGDACGVLRGDTGDTIQPEFVASYQDYVESLKFMTALEPEIICLAHSWVLTQAEAREFLTASLAETYRYRELIESYLTAARGDIEEAVRELARAEYGPEGRMGPPRAAYLTNLAAQVKHIAERLGHDDGPAGAGG